MKRSKFELSLTVLLLVVGCASSRALPPGDLSAKEHDKAADADRATSHTLADRYDNRAVRFVELYPERPAACDHSLPGDCSPYWTMTKNPTDRELALASAYQTRAGRHRQAAKGLREAESKACAHVALADQDMSPFLRQRDVVSVEEIGMSSGEGPLDTPAGASIAFAPVKDLTAHNLQAIVTCQLARNAAVGWDQSEVDCPLNVKGASANVRAVADKLVVDVTTTDAAAAHEILKRARALVPGTAVSYR